jgi:hypothetical protein
MLHLHVFNGGDEPCRPPPLRDQRGVGPSFEYELNRPIEQVLNAQLVATRWDDELSDTHGASLTFYCCS